MKAVIITNSQSIEFADIPEPTCGDFDVITETLACGICNGTDAKIIEGHFPDLETYPLVLGHEAVGRVVAKGSKVRSFQIGDMVLRPGLEDKDLEPHGLASGWGAFAEYTKATDAAALKANGIHEFNGLFLSQQTVPEWMDPVDAVMLITYKETLSALLQFGVRTAQPVVVIGAGPVGQCLARACKLLGCYPVIVADFNEDRLARAQAAGVDHVVNSRNTPFRERVREVLPDGAPFVVDAVGSVNAMNDALAVIANHGKICVYGVPPAPELMLDASLAPYHWQLEYLIFPTFEVESAVHDSVISYVSLGFLKPRDIVDDVAGFEELPQAMDRILSRSSLKAVIRLA